MVKTGCSNQIFFFLIWRFPFGSLKGFPPNVGWLLSSLLNNHYSRTALHCCLTLGPGLVGFFEEETLRLSYVMYWGEGRVGWRGEWSHGAVEPAASPPAPQGAVVHCPLRGPVAAERPRSCRYHLAQSVTRGHLKKNVTLAQSWSITQRLPERGCQLTTLLSGEQ